MPELEKLFTPIKINKLELKNRIVMAPMETRYGSLTGEVTQRYIDYYVERAAGGTALLITGITYIRRDGKWCHEQIGIDEDRFVEGLRKLTYAVHEAGAKIAVQLCFYPGGPAGAQLVPLRDGRVMYGTGTRAAGFGREEWPNLYSVDEIQDLAGHFAEGARRAKDAGFDAVEFHGASAYLLRQFMSPASNRRTDDYGGDLWRITRMSREVLQLSRSKVGPDFPLIYRLHGEERYPDGRTLEQTQTLAPWLVEAGADALHVAVFGSGDTYVSTWIPVMGVQQGFSSYLAGAIKRVVNVPVMAVGRIADARVAERILQAGEADLIAMGRSLVADAYLPNKSQAGEFDDVRRCIACNQGCTEGLSREEGITCIYNPEVGREAELKIRPALKRKKVVIVGGGPAGLEAARSAALRGHDVTLYEKGNELGGQLRLAAVPPTRGELAQVPRWLARQARKAGAKIEMGVTVTMDMLKSLQPDIVVLATGSMPLLPDVPGKVEKVVIAHDVLDGKVEVGEKVLILGGGVAGYGTADHLARKGKKVTVLEVLESASSRVAPPGGYSGFLYGSFKSNSVQVLACSSLREILDDGVRVSNERKASLLAREPFLQALSVQGFGDFMGDQEVEVLRGYDTIVSALGGSPNNQMALQLRGSSFEVYVVGEASRSRDARESIIEAAQVGYKI